MALVLIRTVPSLHRSAFSLLKRTHLPAPFPLHFLHIAPFSAMSTPSTLGFPVRTGQKPAIPVPKAEKLPKKLTEFGDVRVDNYYWLRSDGRDDEKVLAQVRTENAYTKAVLEDATEPLRKTLFDEMRARIKEDDSQPAVRKDDWFYYTRMETGGEYAIHCRRKANATAEHSIHDDIDEGVPEEIVLDENVRAGERQYYHIADLEVSPDHSTVAWGEDTDGSEKYTLRFRNLEDGRDLDDVVENTSGNVAWCDNRVLFFLTKDELDRPHKLWRYELGSGKAPHLVYTEEDDAFYLGIHRSDSDAYMYLHSGAAITSECWYIATTTPYGEWKCLIPRQHGVEYHVTDHGLGRFVVVTNENALNSKVLFTTDSQSGELQTLIAHREEVKVEDATTFKNHMVLTVRQNGLRQLVVYDLSNEENGLKLTNDRVIAMDDEAYAMSNGGGEYKSEVIRFSYSSLVKPRTVYDYNLCTGERAIKKIQPVLGGFDSEHYITRRLWATASDGVKVPISIAYRPDITTLPAPVHLEAYGSYETCNDPSFSSVNLSLMDRGVIIAIAHVRGGGEMGRHWYEDGKYTKKHNTWRDFLTCSQYLIDEGLTAKGKITIEGCSAGGLLIGASLNECEEGLYAGAVSLVGFSDVLTTMLDPSIPLTTTEWDEWGNPQKEDIYVYMKGYSPCDNVPEGKAFPPILSTAGLNDPRVGYWEPMKWVQRVRECDKNGGVNVLYRCLMESGHFAKSGRFQRLEENALVFAFVLCCHGVA